MTTNCS